MDESEEKIRDRKIELKNDLITLRSKLEKVQHSREKELAAWTANKDVLLWQEMIMKSNLEVLEGQKLNLTTRNDHLTSELEAARPHIEKLQFLPPCGVVSDSAALKPTYAFPRITYGM